MHIKVTCRPAVFVFCVCERMQALFYLMSCLKYNGFTGSDPDWLQGPSVLTCSTYNQTNVFSTDSWPKNSRIWWFSSCHSWGTCFMFSCTFVNRLLAIVFAQTQPQEVNITEGIVFVIISCCSSLPALSLSVCLPFKEYWNVAHTCLALKGEDGLWDLKSFSYVHMRSLEVNLCWHFCKSFYAKIYCIKYIYVNIFYSELFSETLNRQWENSCSIFSFSWRFPEGSLTQFIVSLFTELHT